jgi:hypothetical protein
VKDESDDESDDESGVPDGEGEEDHTMLKLSDLAGYHPDTARDEAGAARVCALCGGRDEEAHPEGPQTAAGESPDMRAIVRVHRGGSAIVTDREAALLPAHDDCGLQPIGPACLGRNPALWNYLQSPLPTFGGEDLRVVVMRAWRISRFQQRAMTVPFDRLEIVVDAQTPGLDEDACYNTVLDRLLAAEGRTRAEWDDALLAESVKRSARYETSARTEFVAALGGGATGLQAYEIVRLASDWDCYAYYSMATLVCMMRPKGGDADWLDREDGRMTPGQFTHLALGKIATRQGILVARALPSPTGEAARRSRHRRHRYARVGGARPALGR